MANYKYVTIYSVCISRGMYFQRGIVCIILEYYYFYYYNINDKV